MTSKDFIDSKIIPIARTLRRGGDDGARGERLEMTRRDLLNLGVIALDAADRARAAGDRALAEKYTALAEKCDRAALETEEA